MAKVLEISDSSKIQNILALKRSSNKSDFRVRKLSFDQPKVVNIVFSDEIIFTIELIVNNQNDRVYLSNLSYENLNHRLRNQVLPLIMVWVAITVDRRSQFILVACSPCTIPTDWCRNGSQKFPQEHIQHCLITISESPCLSTVD